MFFRAMQTISAYVILHGSTCVFKPLLMCWVKGLPDSIKKIWNSEILAMNFSSFYTSEINF